MSNKDLNKKPVVVFIASAVIASIIGVGAHFLAFNTFSSSKELKENSNRDIASVKANQLTKQSILKGKPTLRSRYKGKMRGHILASVEKDPSSDSETLVLNGTVHSAKDLDRVTIKWMIPEDSELIDGTLEDEIFNVEANKDVQIQIRIKAKSTNQRVTLHAYQVVNGENHGNVAQFNSSPQVGVSASKLKGSNDFKIDPNTQKILQ